MSDILSPSAILTSARAYLSDPDHWCQGRLFVSGEHPQACSIGAIRFAGSILQWVRYAPASPDDRPFHLGTAVWPSIEQTERAQRAEEYLKVAVEDAIPTWNDEEGRTHAEVLAAFDRAIALAEADETEQQSNTDDDGLRLVILPDPSTAWEPMPTMYESDETVQTVASGVG